MSSVRETSPNGPFIPGSIKLGSNRTTDLIANKIIGSDGNPDTLDVVIEEGEISNLIDPTENQDSATRNYVNDVFSINKSLSSIDINDNTTYTGSQVVGGFIQRFMNDSNRTDTFPTASELVSEVGTSANMIECVIQNMSTNSSTDSYDLVLDLFQDGINMIGSRSNQLVINPFSLIILKIFITNFTSGSESVSISYDLTFDQTLSDNIFYAQNSLNIENAVRTSNIYSVRTNLFVISSNTTYTSAQIVNSVITRTGSSPKEDTFPLVSDVITELGFSSPNAVTESWSFQTVIRNVGNDILTINESSDILFSPPGSVLLAGGSSITFLVKFSSNTQLTAYIIRIASKF